MVAVVPINAWVVEQAWATTVVGHAYDGLRPEQRRRLADASPDSFFNVLRSPSTTAETMFPPTCSRATPGRFERLLEAGRFRPPSRPALYVYRLRSSTHEQWAVVGDVPVAAFLDGEVRAHERTHERKEAELADHLSRLRMQLVPPSASPIAGRRSSTAS